MDASTLHRLSMRHDFDAAAGDLWALLQDFGRIDRWWPSGEAIRIERVVVEGEGVGMTRHIYNAGFERPISERLDFIDAQARVLKLSIGGERPAGISHYQATGRVESLGEQRCRLYYDAEFSAGTGDAAPARTMLETAYTLMFKGLGQTLAMAH